MRKFTLVFIFMLTLCVGHVWGEVAWVGEVITTSSNGFYLYNVGTKLFLCPTSPYGVEAGLCQSKWVFSVTSGNGTISTTLDNTTYYIFVQQNIIQRIYKFACQC